MTKQRNGPGPFYIKWTPDGWETRDSRTGEQLGEPEDFMEAHDTAATLNQALLDYEASPIGEDDVPY